VTPFVSSASLLADLPPPTPWSERKLLLVVLGRIINPALSTVRWHAWLALHSNPLATVYQYNLKGLWMGAACDLPTANGTRREAQLSECRRVWGAEYDCESQLNSAKKNPCRRGWSSLSRGFRAASAEAIRGKYIGEADFKEEAMRHKFCLVTRGDYPSTRKVTEHLLLVGSMGCIPILALGNLPSPLATLPLSAAFNLCRITYIVDNDRAAFGEATLNALTAVTEQEARIRWAEAATLQSAFVYRGNSSLKEPSAAEAVLAMLCHHARTLRGGLCRQGRFVQDPAGAYRSVTPDTCPPPQVTETERREEIGVGAVGAANFN